MQIRVHLQNNLLCQFAQKLWQLHHLSQLAPVQINKRIMAHWTLHTVCCHKPPKTLPTTVDVKLCSVDVKS